MVELLATVVLMGFAIATVIGLIFTATKITSMHRGTTTANTWVHNLGEDIISPTATLYAQCATDYDLTGVPTGYGAEVTAVRRLSNPAAESPTWVAMGAGCVNDGGVQQVTIETWSLGNPAQRERLVVVKRDTTCLSAANPGNGC